MRFLFRLNLLQLQLSNERSFFSLKKCRLSVYIHKLVVRDFFPIVHLHCITETRIIRTPKNVPLMSLLTGLDCKAPCKRMQQCWPTTANIVGCYMLRPFSHPVACCCAKFETGETLTYVQMDATTPNFAGQQS